MVAAAPLSFQKAKEHKQAVVYRLAQLDVAQSDLRLLAQYFNADEVTGYCTTLTEEGRYRYAPLFKKHELPFTGLETFRELQYSLSDYYDTIYDETAELAKAVRAGGAAGAELQFISAVLAQDAAAIGQSASNLAEKLASLK